MGSHRKTDPGSENGASLPTAKQQFQHNQGNADQRSDFGIRE